MRSTHGPLARLLGALTFAALVQQGIAKAIVKKESGYLAPAKQAQPKSFRIEVIRSFPHVGKPFTQGLEFTADGKQLVETSGSFPAGTASFVRLLDPYTGATIRQLTDGLDNRFAEGITRDQSGNWFMSTFQDKKAVEYSPDLKFIADHEYPNTGWGLTQTLDGSSFLATNGSEHVMTLQKGTFKEIDVKVVTCLGKRVIGLNELEMVENFQGLGPTLLGNVYQSRLVLAVDPATMQCTGVFNLDGLGLTEAAETAGFHVANGLAYNKTGGSLIATGKNWDTMFELRILPDAANEALPILGRYLLSAPPASYKAAFVLSPNGESDYAIKA